MKLKAKEEKTIVSAIRKSHWNFDGWVNILTGLGISGKDKRVAATPMAEIMSQAQLEELYEADDIAERVCDRIPFDGTREWVEFSNLESEEKKKITSIYKNLRVQTQYRAAWQWARLYGGAGILLALEDGLSWDKPVDFTKIKRVKNLLVVNRYELISEPKIINDINSPAFGLPEFYRLSTPGGQENLSSAQLIHHSRVIRFEGVKLPRRRFIAHNYWGGSILSRIREIISNFNQSHNSVVSVIQDFRQGVLKMKGLGTKVVGGQSQKIMDRLSLFNTTRSVLNTVVIDNDEEWDVHTSTLTGLKDVLEQVNNRLVAATGMPHTIILGDSPSGLGADGRSEEVGYYDHVRHQQEAILREPINYLNRIIEAAKEYKFKPSEEWGYEFAPLWQMSDKERAEYEKTVAEKDAIYITNGVLMPDEVALSRYGGDKFSDDTKIEPERMDELNDPNSASGTPSEDDPAPGSEAPLPGANPKPASPVPPAGSGPRKV